MKNLHPTKLERLLLTSLLALALGLAGCSSDNPAAPGGTPDAQTAAGLTTGVTGPAAVAGVMDDLETFRSPLSSLAQDAGIDGDLPLGQGADDGGASYDYPSKALLAANAFRGAKLTAEVGAAAVAGRTCPLVRLSTRALEAPPEKAAGDTIAAFYYDTADSTGLDALIETDTPDVLRLVSQRTYPNAGPLQVATRAFEIVFDSQGTLETGDDDEYWSVHHSLTRGDGEAVDGTIAPLSGDGPMIAGVAVRASERVDDPFFHPLQQYTTAEIVLDPGDFRVEGDEIFHTLSASVHWRSGAVNAVSVAPETGDEITSDSIETVAGTFTAAPANLWLESTADTLRVRMGDLEDPSDDLLYEVGRAAVFDGVASDGGHPRETVHMTPAEPVAPGDEPCGGTAEQDVRYPANWWLVHLNRSADIGCDGAGSLTILMEFHDGSSYTRTVTWDGAGGATLTETRADGTVVTGSFDESTGAYSLTTTFPEGHDPISRERHGTALEGSVDAWESVVWQDEHDDQAHFTAQDGETGTTGSGYRIVGDVRVDFEFADGDDGGASGSWERNDGATGEFALEMLEGGGRHLTFASGDPAADGSPGLTGEVWYAPDGSGTGTVTFTQYGNTVTYTITFGPDGDGELDAGDGDVIRI